MKQNLKIKIYVWSILKNASFCMLGNDSISYSEINFKWFLIPICTNHPNPLFHFY